MPAVDRRRQLANRASAGRPRARLDRERREARAIGELHSTRHITAARDSAGEQPRPVVVAKVASVDGRKDVAHERVITRILPVAGHRRDVGLPRARPGEPGFGGDYGEARVEQGAAEQDLIVATKAVAGFGVPEGVGGEQRALKQDRDGPARGRGLADGDLPVNDPRCYTGQPSPQGVAVVRAVDRLAVDLATRAVVDRVVVLVTAKPVEQLSAAAKHERRRGGGERGAEADHAASVSRSSTARARGLKPTPTSYARAEPPLQDATTIRQGPNRMSFDFAGC